MIATLLLLALGAQPSATPAAPAPSVEVAQASWESFDRLPSRLDLPTARMVTAVERILRQSECRLAGQSARRFNINVRYAVRFDAARRPQRIIVEDLGCRPLETFVGGVVSDMLRHNILQLPRRSQTPRWYGNVINFNLAS